jgi:hypothetical protein
MAGAAAASHRASTASSATWITHSEELLRSEIHGFINTLLVSIYWVYVDSATAGVYDSVRDWSVRRAPITAA